MRHGFLYKLEFINIPEKFNRDRCRMLYQMIYDKTYLCEMFNNAYKTALKEHTISKKIKFKERDFQSSVLSIGIGNDFSDRTNMKWYYVACITLPEPNPMDTPRVWCRHYFIPFYTTKDTTKVFDLYTDEFSCVNTTCIGMMKDGKHYNFGLSLQNLDLNAKKVFKLACGDVELTRPLDNIVF